MCINLNDRSARHGGFSLVELMVAMAITLLATVTMFQVFGLFEAQKQRSSGGSDVQQGASLALLLLAKDAKDAGFGVNDPLIIGCPTWVFANGVTTNRVLAPVTIADGGAAGSDTITLVKGGGVRDPATPDNYVPLSSAALAQNYLGDTQDIFLSSVVGINTYDLIVLAQQNTANCALFEATAVNAMTRAVSHAGGNDPFSQPRQNPPGGAIVDNLGVGVSYTVDGANPVQAFVLGRKPVGGLMNNDLFVTYSIQNNRQLLRTSVLSGNAQAVMDDVVAIQAQYGMDVTSIIDGIQIDSWSDAPAMPLTRAQLQSIGAIRVAIVVRGKFMLDRRESATLCKDDTSPAEVGLANFWANPATPTVDSAAYTAVVATVKAAMPGTNGDVDRWSCYRYRIFETTLPMRNVIWSS